MQITNKNQFLNYLLLVGGILVLLNLVGRTSFLRWDITDGGIYKLSSSSKDVIGHLEESLTAKVFYSGDLPGPYANSRRYLQDLLEEFEAYSGGKFRFEFINPDKDPKAQDQARTYNIPPVQLQALENDKMEIKNVYMGMVLNYRDKRETLPVIQGTQGLEYNITATIKKVTASGLKTIGLISEENEEISTQNLNQFLSQLYTVRRVNLHVPVDPQVQVLLMNGATDSIRSEGLYHLDQFLMRGGKLFIGQTTIRDMLQQGFALPIQSDIFSFLEHYGVRVGTDLLIDRSCSQIQVQSQQGMFVFRNAIDYPPFPLIKKFNREHMISENASIARLFFSNELTKAESSDPGILFTPLMYTSSQTGILQPQQGSFYMINPSQNPMMQVFPFPSKVVAAIVEGKVKSYFEADTAFSKRPGFISSSQSSCEFVIVADNQFFNDRRAGGAEENVNFILNVVDYLANDRELIALRARNIKIQPLENVSDGARQTWKWINVVIPAVLVLVLGAWNWRRQKAKRKSLEEMYG